MIWEIRQGDCLEVLRTLESESVQTCVTSPPYWGLRDYGTATWDGGDPECDHAQGRPGAGRADGIVDERAQRNRDGAGAMGGDCGKCGAKRIDSQLGLEPTPEQYVENLVNVFRKVRRVLRDDGTVWLNLGDSYAGSWGNYGGQNRGKEGGQRPISTGSQAQSKAYEGLEEWRPPQTNLAGSGIKPKDLVGIPWRVAFALQADGWWLRSDIVWSKPNPMPESVTDRPTRAHEYLYLLAKGQWKTRVVQFSNLPSERFHLLDDLRPGATRTGTTEVCVRLATAFLDRAQAEQTISLPPFYAEEWQQGADGSDSDFVRGLPVEHRPAVWGARFLCANASAKEFLQKVDRLSVALADGDDFLISGGASGPSLLTPNVAGDGEAAITVHHAGEICKVNFASHALEISRPTRCSYFYDADAIREDAIHAGKTVTLGPKSLSVGQATGMNREPSGNGKADSVVVASGRNRRSVWEITTQPYPEAHFATFPPKLVEPCILAGSPPKCCGECGAPRERITRTTPLKERTREPIGKGYAANAYSSPQQQNRGGNELGVSVEQLGWRSTCSHENESGQPIVLDPFAGAGTTGLVATQHGRDFIGIELNPEYAEMARERIRRYEANPAGALEGDPEPIEGQIGLL